MTSDNKIHVENCETCKSLLTETYVQQNGTVCPSCQRDVGLKIWYSLWGPGSAPKRKQE